LIWRTARRTVGRERDDKKQRLVGTSATERHNGRAVSELRHIPQSVVVTAGGSWRRQDETRPPSTENVQNSHRKHSRSSFNSHSTYFQ